MTALARLREWLLTSQPPEARSLPDAMGLVDAARAQGLAGLLHAALLSARAPWPAAALEALGELRKRLAARAIRQGQLLERGLGALAHAGLRALPLKGAALVGLVYEDTGERPMADVDLLAVDGFEASLDVLGAAGFRLVDRADHAVALRDHEIDLLVELHRSPTSCPGFYPVDPRELWERGIPLPGSPERRRPCHEDLLLLLCLHAAFQHGLRLPLLQYLDLRRLIERSRLDLEAVVERAVAWRAAGAAWAALVSSSRLVGARVPPTLLDPLRTRTPGGLVRGVEARLAEPESLLRPLADVAIAELARLRWLLASGRRLEWIRRTLESGEAGAGRSRGQFGAVARRAIGLARRWGPRSW